MLRLVSGRCFGTASPLLRELRAIHSLSTPNITSSHQVPHQLSLYRNLSLKVPEKDDSSDIIYRGRLEKDILRVKAFSMTTSVLGLVFQPILYNQASNLPVLIAGCSVIGFFTFVTPVLIHQLAKRHVNRIVYKKETDSYVAYTTTFFFGIKEIPIAPGEAKVPDCGGPFTSLEVRGIPLMVELTAFENHHLVRMLGYDKPLDIEHERIAALCEEADKREKMKEPVTYDEEKTQERKREKKSSRM